MSRNHFDEVEKQIRNIGWRHWKSIRGWAVRSAAKELRKGKVVIFGNNRGNLYFGKDEILPEWQKGFIHRNDIGLFMSKDKVIELNLTEVQILNEMWSRAWEPVKCG